MKNIFIFVVCGSREHLDTLHFSLSFLKKYSKNEIWVLTDSSRNEIPVEHENIIDIKTPKHFDNHQASIYLKTGIYQFVPKGNNYCYLDSDVIALNKFVDLIFDEFIAPIRFGADHFKMASFSPLSLNCGCEEKYTSILNKENKLFKASLLKHDKNRLIIKANLLKKQNDLQLLLQEINDSKLKKISTAIRFALSKKEFKLNSDYIYNKSQKYWQDQNGEIILYEFDFKKIESESNFTFNQCSKEWTYLFEADFKCNHLQKEIKQLFDVHINKDNWQHWNGGVFLFNDESHDFLQDWHKKTNKILNIDYWKTRDQASLIATVWKFNLQDHPILNKKWNFLADSNNSNVDFQRNGNFTDDNWNTSSSVNFIHVYHRFNDKTWDLWNYIELLKNEH